MKKNKQTNKQTNTAKALAYKEVNIMYEKGLLGISSAEPLINTLWLLNSVHFALRGCGDHRQMAWGDVKLLEETDRTEYLEYTEWQTESRSGAEPRNIRTVKPKALATQLASLEEIQFFSLHVQILCSEKASFDATATRAISC